MSKRVPVLSAVLALVTMLAVVVGASALRYRQEDVSAECARVFEDRKTEPSGYHWGWLPPGWRCEYESQEVSEEHRLPVFRR